MWALSTGDCVVLARFARVPLGQGGASSLIVFVEEGAAFIAALSLVLGIFVFVGLFWRLGAFATWSASFVAVSARY